MGDDHITSVREPIDDVVEKFDENEHEVFKRGEGQVDFRTVGWVKAAVIFTKSQFSSPLQTFDVNSTNATKSFSQLVF
jgi:hypothetical protein